MAWLRKTLATNWVNIAVVAALVLAFVLLRSTPSDIGSAQVFVEQLGDGEPVVVYFFSNA